MSWGFFGRIGGSMPYVKWNELNEDWILAEVKKALEDWARYHAEWDEWKGDLSNAFEDLVNYVNNYFANLDLEDEVRQVIEQMAAAGDLTEIIKDQFDTFQNDLNILSGRVDNLAAAIAPGTTSADAELIDIRVSPTGNTYPTAGDAVRGEENYIMTGLISAHQDDIKIFDDKEYINLDLALESGLWTDGQPAIENPHYIRSAGYFKGDVYIINPGGTYTMGIARFDEAYNIKSYWRGQVPGEVTDGYKDELVYLPPLEVGFYRIRAKRYVNNTQQLMDPAKSYLMAYVGKEKNILGAGTFTTAGGFAYKTTEAVNKTFLSLDNGNYIKVENPQGKQFAIFKTVDEITFVNIFGGWNNASNYLMAMEPGAKYLFRVNAAVDLTIAENYKTFIDDFKVSTPQNIYCYNRQYSDITNDLIFEDKAISNLVIEDSTIEKIAKLPNVGNIEVRLNAPIGKFGIYRKSGNNITELQPFTHYQYRYTGDFYSEYYVAVRLEAETDITLQNAVSLTRVFTYDDQGADVKEQSGLMGLNVAFMGDSIVQGRFCKNSNNVNQSMIKPYAMLISEIINIKDPIIYGIGGATIAEKDWKSIVGNAGDATGYDIIFIHAGTNDYGSDIPAEQFTNDFTQVVQTLKANNSDVIVITPTARGTNTANAVGMRLSDYVEIEKTIAEAEGVKVIDLYKLTNTNTPFKNSMSDNLHPDETGHIILAELINTAI